MNEGIGFGMEKCTFVGGIEVDMLIGAGCISEMRACFVGMEIFGMAPNYRKAVESGLIKVSEESEATIALGLRESYLKVHNYYGKNCGNRRCSLSSRKGAITNANHHSSYQ